MEGGNGWREKGICANSMPPLPLTRRENKFLVTKAWNRNADWGHEKNAAEASKSADNWLTASMLGEAE